MSGEAPSDAKLIDVVLDDATIGRATADVEHERAVAIFDIGDVAAQNFNILPLKRELCRNRRAARLGQSRSVSGKGQTDNSQADGECIFQCLIHFLPFFTVR